MQQAKYDPSLDFLYQKSRPLDAIFKPKNVALIGASEKEGSVGRTLLSNLLGSNFGGKVFPVNPKRETVLNIPAYPTVEMIPEKVDLAVIATPANTVPQVIRECVKAKIPTAVIISAGFKELGKAGKDLEEEVMREAKKGNMRIIGPNCLGVMNPIVGLNATFAADMALEGNIAFISQSGALCTAVLDLSLQEKVGFSAFVSIGSMMDVNWGDLIDYFGNDPHTKSILIYMESIGDPRAFLSAAREVALRKPIILIKAGVTEESAKAAASHTGALAGSDAVFNAALKRVGVLRVKGIEDLFHMAEVLSKQPLPKGPNLAIVTNAGGPGVIATDALIENGGKLSSLSKETLDALNGFLPSAWSHNNPVDVLGDASPALYLSAVEVVSKDPNSDGILVILTPQNMTDPTKTAELMKTFSHLPDKPLLASWMGAGRVKKGAALLTEWGIPTFSFPDTACKIFAYMWSYSNSLSSIYETPSPAEMLSSPQEMKEKKEIVNEIFLHAQKQKRTLLTEYESKKVLEAFDIPVVPTMVARTKKEAVEIAKKMGFPLVLKLYSYTLTHKTDVGGVKLNLNNLEAVEEAFDEIEKSVLEKAGKVHFGGVTVQPMVKLDGYELILGSSVDPEFGPVLLFGTGGQLVEVFKDRSLGLPPLTTTLARRMMENTKIYQALKGVRGRKAVDLSKLEKLLVRFSYLIAKYPQIKEFDINPLLVSSDTIQALDARIVLYPEDTPQEKLPKLAIRPYPYQYEEIWKTKDGDDLFIRPIRPEDEPLIVDFFYDLSEQTVLQRYLQILRETQLTAHEMVFQFCFNDYDREIALVTERENEKGQKEVVSIARLTKLPGTEDARFAIVIKDPWQHKGIGSKLLQNLLQIAKNEGVKRVVANMLPENEIMKKLCTKLGFTFTPQKEGLVFLEKKIQ